MVIWHQTDHSNSVIGSLLPPHGLFFPISSKGSKLGHLIIKWQVIFSKNSRTLLYVDVEGVCGCFCTKYF